MLIRLILRKVPAFAVSALGLKPDMETRTGTAFSSIGVPFSAERAMRIPAIAKTATTTIAKIVFLVRAVGEMEPRGPGLFLRDSLKGTVGCTLRMWAPSFASFRRTPHSRHGIDCATGIPQEFPRRRSVLIRTYFSRLSSLRA